MLSLAFPATGVRIPSDLYLGTGFTPWDTESVEAQFAYPPQEPVFSNSGSDESTPKTVSSNSGSDDGEPGRDPPESDLNANPSPNPIDERKRRRMISNRESARRSRMRKHKHLENLRNQVNRHKTVNRELMNRLRFVCHHGQLLRQENDRLRSESAMLRQKLWDIRQVLLVRQLQSQLSTPAWPCNNNMTSMNEQNPPSSIT